MVYPFFPRYEDTQTVAKYSPVGENICDVTMDVAIVAGLDADDFGRKNLDMMMSDRVLI